MNACRNEVELAFRRESPLPTPTPMPSRFSLQEEVEVDGRRYAVRTDFRVVLEILVMLRDPDLSDGDKAEALLRMFYVERPTDADAAIDACYRFIQPHPIQQSAPRSLVDWELDFDLMAAPVNHILGCECRALPYLHWHTCLAAWMEIGPETLFGQVLRIREKLRTGHKLEKTEQRFLRQNRSLVILPTRLSSEEEKLMAEWT